MTSLFGLESLDVRKLEFDCKVDQYSICEETRWGGGPGGANNVYLTYLDYFFGGTGRYKLGV